MVSIHLIRLLVRLRPAMRCLRWMFRPMFKRATSTSEAGRPAFAAFLTDVKSGRYDLDVVFPAS